MARNSSKTFLLLRWLEDEMVGVFPVTCVVDKDQESIQVGAIVKAKYLSTLYDAEILQISKNKAELNKTTKALLNFDITRDELLASATSEQPSLTEAVHTTTDRHGTPVKSKTTKKQATSRKPVSKKKAKEQATKNKASDFLQAQVTARQLFADSDESDSDDPGPPPVKKVKAASVTYPETEKTDAILQKQAEMIKNLQQQLQLLQQRSRSVSPPVNKVTNNIVTHSNFESIQKQVFASPSVRPQPALYTQGLETTSPVEGAVVDLDTYGSLNTSPIESAEEAIHMDTPKVKSTTVTPRSIIKKEKRVQLCEGYEVFVTKRQLDEVVSSTGGVPTRLFRALLSVFFDPLILATSSALGNAKKNKANVALDKTILEACIAFTQQRHSVARTVLIDAANDKCAQARRKKNYIV